MDKKNLKILIGIFAVIFFLGIFISYKITYHITSDINLTQYDIDSLANEIALRDLTIVSSKNNAYFAKGTYLEKLRSDFEVSDAYVSVRIDGKHIFSTGISGPFVRSDISRSIVIPDQMIENIRITDKSILTVEMRYEVSGAQKEFHQDIELKNCKNKNEPLRLK